MEGRNWVRRKKQFTEEYQVLLMLIKRWDIYIFYPPDSSHFIRPFYHFGTVEAVSESQVSLCEDMDKIRVYFTSFM